MKKTTIIYAAISAVFILAVLLNVFTSPKTLERGDNYYSILGAKDMLKYHLQPMGDYDLFQQKSNALLNHPPLYVYMWGIIFLIFKNPIAINLTGVIFLILAGLMVVKIIKLSVREIKESSLIIAYALFLSIPLIIQAGYLIDLDVILPLIMLLFVYSYLKNPKAIVLNSLLFALLWFTKLQGIPMMVAAIFFYLLITKKGWKDYLNAAMIVFAGTAIFFILLYGYSYLMHADILKIFAHSSAESILLKQLTDMKKAFLTSAWAAKQMIIWISPFLILLYVISLISNLKKEFINKHQKFLLPVLVSIFALLELIPIGTYGWNFPKYYVGFVPFMIISISPLIDKIKINKKDIWKILALLGILVIYFLIIPDPFIPKVSEAFTQKDYLSLASQVLFQFDLLIAPLILVLLFYGRKMDKNKLIKILVILGLVVSLSIAVMQITKPYSTNNMYGDSHSDLIATLSYLKNNTNSTDVALLFAHVGYYFGNSNNTNWYNSMLCYNSEDCMKNITENPKVKFMQFYPKDLERIDGKLKEIVGREFDYDREFGEYVIYKRKV